MKFLRLAGEKGCDSEYVVDDLNAKYLKGIGSLNIIVGANNSRKSRFMRQVINMPFKLLIDAEQDLNKLESQLERLFARIPKEMYSSGFIAFGYRHSTNPTEKFQLIQSFMSKNTSGSLSLQALKESLERVLWALVSNTVGTGQPEEIGLGMYYAVDLAYKILRKNGEAPEIYTSVSNPSGERGIDFGFPNLNNRNRKIKNYDALLDVLEELLELLRILPDLYLDPCYQLPMIYIPSLRGARRLFDKNSNLYKNTLMTQHQLTDNSLLSIETGQDMYEKIAKARNGRRQARLDFADFEQFISRVFFEGKEIDIIAMEGISDDKHVYVSIDSAHDIAVHDLGDGIQAVMNLMLPIFTAKRGSWVFIDEPELHLHPGFQNIFMNAIVHDEAIKDKELRFFITTHSNHILSESLLSGTDTEVMVFSTRDNGASNITSFSGNEAQTLQLLGVLNTSVLVSNCSIWVEGVTDRLYVKAILHAYQKSAGATPRLLSEGLNYSFIEYAGSNLVHYGFGSQAQADNLSIEDKINTFFINSNVFVIADTDSEKADKHEFYIKKQTENFVYFQTEMPEIENILPAKLLKAWLAGEVGCQAEEIEKCFEESHTAFKLGDFFKGKFSKSKTTTRQFGSDGTGGTLRGEYKNRLAKFVYDQVMDGRFSWEDLKESPILAKLGLQLYQFILKKNKPI